MDSVKVTLGKVRFRRYEIGRHGSRLLVCWSVGLVCATSYSWTTGPHWGDMESPRTAAGTEGPATPTIFPSTMTRTREDFMSAAGPGPRDGTGMRTATGVQLERVQRPAYLQQTASSGACWNTPITRAMESAAAPSIKAAPQLHCIISPSSESPGKMVLSTMTRSNTKSASETKLTMMNNGYDANVKIGPVMAKAAATRVNPLDKPTATYTTGKRFSKFILAWVQSKHARSHPSWLPHHRSS